MFILLLPFRHKVAIGSDYIGVLNIRHGPIEKESGKLVQDARIYQGTFHVYHDKVLLRPSPPFKCRYCLLWYIQGMKQDGVKVRQGRQGRLVTCGPTIRYRTIVMGKNVTPLSKQKVVLVPKFGVVQDCLGGSSSSSSSILMQWWWRFATLRRGNDQGRSEPAHGQARVGR